MTKKKPGAAAPLPSREDLLAYIQDNPDAGKREIARAFGIKGDRRKVLKARLKELEDNGLVQRGRKRRLATSGHLPDVTVVEVVAVDNDGDPLARPVNWRGETEPPAIVMLPERGGRPALGIGDRALARLKRVASGRYEGRTMRRIERRPDRVLGVYRLLGGEGRVMPTDRRAKTEYLVTGIDAAGAKPGDLVFAEVAPGRRLGLPRARVTERLGASLDDPRAFSLIAIHANRIPVDFATAAIAEANAAKPVGTLGKREDLRETPLVTIDGADARDFDDAVWAEPDPANDGGWHALVAIADVAHYVRPGGALDQAANERGNSVYFPDRVVPMLPEALSNDLCSLRPGEARPCLAVHLWIDGDGGLRRHRFLRGLMCSAARLTYEQVQAARDGHADEIAGPLGETVIAPLYGVLEALLRARKRRGAIDLDLPERKAVLDDAGHVAEIVPRPRLDSHRLIEELMIAANVAAAETLEKRKTAAMFRIHDEPAAEKVADLRDFLATLDLKLAAGQHPRPVHFNRVLAQVEDLPHGPAVNTAILRSQAKAEYSPENVGHFGLSLRRYSHFTSPIRRYADLLVHRALIRALGFGRDGLPDGAGEGFEVLGEHISMTERRAQAAERQALERYIAAYMESRVGASFTGRVSGVTRFGLFVMLDETGADGIVPRRSLGRDAAVDEAGHEMTMAGRAIRLGDAVEVRLREANVATGGLVFELLEGGRETTERRPRKKPAKRQHGPRRRRS